MDRNVKDTITVCVTVAIILYVLVGSILVISKVSEPKQSYIVVQGNLDLYAIHYDSVTLVINGININLKECPDDLHYFLGEETIVVLYGKETWKLGNFYYEGSLVTLGRAHEEF